MKNAEFSYIVLFREQIRSFSFIFCRYLKFLNFIKNKLFLIMNRKAFLYEWQGEEEESV
ncbi:hypothetical protein A943_10040 [Bacillus sp. CPSM8]|nr:hypothetical protein A943_10040 [Bacillus sp. CPSM8]KUL13937.1 hypothetical protein LI7559_05350 [Bacillus licheniformis LMG 7559]KUL17917.1 hypothetical protein LI6934_08755 [Bacillus licheniformis LMG 6934]